MGDAGSGETAKAPLLRLTEIDLGRLLLTMTIIFGIAGLARSAAAAAEGSVAAIGALCCLVAVLLALILVRMRDRPRAAAARGALLVIAGAILVLAFAVGGDQTAVFATSLPFAFSIAWHRPRWLSILGLVLAIAAAVAIAGLLPGATGYPAAEGFAMLALSGSACIAFLAGAIGWQAQQRLEQHHEDQRELAVARERLRFATDLHDIQGHTLLTIKVKAELARRSLQRNPARANDELADIERLAAEADDRTRELAQGYRALTLAAELANAEQLLEAAGAAVAIEREGAPDPDWEELFAAVVREATTNILRHSSASAVRIALARAEVRVESDGASGGEEPRREGSGLVGLRRRFDERGGAFEWRRDGERFILVGRGGGDG
ncbi:sensor histidine kinase [Gulosibacter sp. 10]|uniref:sensor histidine kinase n=1 Tax=Gulosibacter sp. 10 TaxID=1255570 RepID=UPI00097EAB0D|nr:histidine kinase [Gulosibacter sp. 10]SJM58052.1 putative two-component system sensor kinase [Gulosibacter sp. 10]